MLIISGGGGGATMGSMDGYVFTTLILCFRSLIFVPHLLNLHFLKRIVLVIMVVCCGLLRSRDIDRIYVTWRKIIRRLWNVPYRTHGRLLPVLLDDYSIEVQFMLRFSNFILKASQSDNSHLSMCANLAYFSDTPVAGNMRVLAQVLNTDSVINIKIKTC